MDNAMDSPEIIESGSEGKLPMGQHMKPGNSMAFRYVMCTHGPYYVKCLEIPIARPVA